MQSTENNYLKLERHLRCCLHGTRPSKGGSGIVLLVVDQGVCFVLLGTNVAVTFFMKLSECINITVGA